MLLLIGSFLDDSISHAFPEKKPPPMRTGESSCVGCSFSFFLDSLSLHLMNFLFPFSKYYQHNHNSKTSGTPRYSRILFLLSETTKVSRLVFMILVLLFSPFQQEPNQPIPEADAVFARQAAESEV